MIEALKNKAVCKAQAAILGRMGETKEAYAIVRQMCAEIKAAKTVTEINAIVAKYL